MNLKGVRGVLSKRLAELEGILQTMRESVAEVNAAVSVAIDAEDEIRNLPIRLAAMQKEHDRQKAILDKQNQEMLEKNRRIAQEFADKENHYTQATQAQQDNYAAKEKEWTAKIDRLKAEERELNVSKRALAVEIDGLQKKKAEINKTLHAMIAENA